MSERITISPSLLSADLSRIEEEIADIQKGGADYVHIDVMDGHFVPNLTFGAPVVKCLAKKSDLPLDIHLMINNPEAQIDDFLALNPAIVAIHAEATNHADRLLHYIQDAGVKAGLAINPGTTVDSVKHLLTVADLVLVMSVNPGFSGQKFISYAPQKVAEVNAYARALGKDIIIEVDGGMNAQTAPLVAREGARMLVAGNGVFAASNRAEAIASIRSAAQSVLAPIA